MNWLQWADMGVTVVNLTVVAYCVRLRRWLRHNQGTAYQATNPKAAKPDPR